MDDVLGRIHDLVAEEKELRSSHHTLTGSDRRRLDVIEHDLDRAWDLLRQRRARAEIGADPDVARERSEDEVEGYRQ